DAGVEIEAADAGLGLGGLSELVALAGRRGEEAAGRVLGEVAGAAGAGERGEQELGEAGLGVLDDGFGSLDGDASVETVAVAGAGVFDVLADAREHPADLAGAQLAERAEGDAPVRELVKASVGCERVKVNVQREAAAEALERGDGGAARAAKPARLAHLGVELQEPRRERAVYVEEEGVVPREPVAEGLRKGE